MQITYKRLKTGLAEARYENRIVVCSLADGRISAGDISTPFGLNLPLTLTDMQVWSYVADQLGNEFTTMISSPKVMIQLIHNGIMFPHSDGIIEDMVKAWAMKLGTPYVNDKVFYNNFFKDYVEICEANGKVPNGNPLLFESNARNSMTLKKQSLKHPQMNVKPTDFSANAWRKKIRSSTATHS